VIWLLNPSFSPRKTRAGSLVDWSPCSVI
jgi:hypothetical protein